MDVELLFSRNPFVQQSGGQFSMIRPNETKEYKLPNFQNKLAIPMPENLADKNVLVEITANGKTRSVPVLANVMNATLNENYGQFQVTDAVNGKPLAKVYVKTYVRLANGTVKFHKDGYTDQRGKFDYASVSTPEASADRQVWDSGAERNAGSADPRGGAAAAVGVRDQGSVACQ